MSNATRTTAQKMTVFSDSTDTESKHVQHQEFLEEIEEIQHATGQHDSVSSNLGTATTTAPQTVTERLISNCVEKFGKELSQYLKPEMSTEEVALITTAFKLDKTNPSRIPEQLPVESLREVVFGFANHLDFCDEAVVEDSEIIHKLVVICSQEQYMTSVPDVFTEDGSSLDYEKINKLYKVTESTLTS